MMNIIRKLIFFFFYFYFLNHLTNGVYPILVEWQNRTKFITCPSFEDIYWETRGRVNLKSFLSSFLSLALNAAQRNALGLAFFYQKSRIFTVALIYRRIQVVPVLYSAENQVALIAVSCSVERRMRSVPPPQSPFALPSPLSATAASLLAVFASPSAEVVSSPIPLLQAWQPPSRITAQRRRRRRRRRG